LRVVASCCAGAASPIPSPIAKTRKSVAPRPGRCLSFDREVYRRRNVVERCVGRLKQWCSVATPYEKWAVNYRAMVVIASLMLWLLS
jgi:transposase